MRVLLIVGRIGDAQADESLAAVHPLALALGLAAGGVQVRVFAAGESAASGGVAREEAQEGMALAVERVQRLDRFPQHWQKGRSAAVAATLRATLSEFEPNLVHLHAWRSLSDDLVLTASRAGVPALVSLHDHYVSCLLATRVEPTEGRACERAFGLHPCVSCAGGVPPETSWVPIEEQYMAFALRRECLLRELRLARRRIVSAADRDALLRPLEPLLAGDPALSFETGPADDDPRAMLALYEEVIAAGVPPPDELPPEEWFEERLRTSAQEAWDAACAERSAVELGFGGET